MALLEAGAEEETETAPTEKDGAASLPPRGVTGGAGCRSPRSLRPGKGHKRGREGIGQPSKRRGDRKDK